MTPELYAASATIVAAILAAVIAFVGTVLGKDQKTSEFRQAWIDSLREDLADFVSFTDVLLDLTFHKAEEEGADAAIAHLTSKADDVAAAGARYNRIMLRLNPHEHTRLIAAIEHLAAFG